MDDAIRLQSLKVQELKQLCQEHGLPITGRKLDLVQRLVHLRQALHGVPEGGDAPPAGDCVAVAAPVPSPARAARRPPGPPAAAAPVEGSQSLPAAEAAEEARGGRGGRGRGRGRGRRANKYLGALGVDSPKADALAADRASGPAAEHPLPCTRCGTRYDVGALGARVQHPEGFWCPACRFREMDPFSAVVGDGLLHQTVANAAGFADFKLNLSKLRQWRRDGLAIEVRMVKVVCAKVSHSWPQSMHFHANGEELFTVRPPEEGHKRRDVPQDISTGLRHGVNAIRIQVVDERPCDYVVGIVLTAARTFPELQAQVGTCEFGAARTRVCSLLAQQRQACCDGSRASPDELVCLAPDKLRLRCPITMDRLRNPVRGKLCQHLQCFSLEAYFTSNRQMRAFNNRWVCPVCTLVLRPADLVFDSYVVSVLGGTPPEVDEVIIAPDGTWSCPAPPASCSMNRPACHSPDSEIEVDDDCAPLSVSLLCEGNGATTAGRPDAGQQSDDECAPLSLLGGGGSAPAPDRALSAPLLGAAPAAAAAVPAADASPAGPPAAASPDSLTCCSPSRPRLPRLSLETVAGDLPSPASPPGAWPGGADGLDVVRVEPNDDSHGSKGELAVDCAIYGEKWQATPVREVSDLRGLAPFLAQTRPPTVEPVPKRPRNGQPEPAVPELAIGGAGAAPPAAHVVIELDPA